MDVRIRAVLLTCNICDGGNINLIAMPLPTFNDDGIGTVALVG